MLSAQEVLQLIQSLIWLLAGVGVFIVGMNFLGDALEKCAGSGMKRMLAKISNNRFSGVAIGAGVTAIIQSSSATSVMVIGLVNAGVMTLMQATSIIMGANIGTTITGVLVALKNDYFDMAMYALAFAGVMMGFSRKDKVKIASYLCSGLGLIFVGLSIMSSDQAFGNDLVERVFSQMFAKIDFPLLLILLGAVFTALMQSSSASTGIVITMVGTQVLPLQLALYIVLGANIGTCVTALLASVGANANSKRVAFVHFAFNVIGAIVFTTVIWIFGDFVVSLLSGLFPGETAMALQMRVSFFHVVFNVLTTLLLLPFVKQLVKLSCLVIKDKDKTDKSLSLKFVDDRLLTMPSVALLQVKKEIENMFDTVQESLQRSLFSLQTGNVDCKELINRNEPFIDFVNSELTGFLIKLSPDLDQSDERVVGSYFHVINDLERIGDYAQNFYEIAAEMHHKEIAFSDAARADIEKLCKTILNMTEIAKDAFENGNKDKLPALDALEDDTDKMKKSFTSNHFVRLAEGSCNMKVGPYYCSAISELERVGDHLVNVAYSIVNPVGAQDDED